MERALVDLDGYATDSLLKDKEVPAWIQNKTPTTADKVAIDPDKLA